MAENWTFATEDTEPTEGMLMHILLCDLGAFCGKLLPVCRNFKQGMNV
jgi:hypothetical protein